MSDITEPTPEPAEDEPTPEPAAPIEPEQEADLLEQTDNGPRETDGDQPAEDDNGPRDDLVEE